MNRAPVFLGNDCWFDICDVMNLGYLHRDVGIIPTRMRRDRTQSIFGYSIIFISQYRHAIFCLLVTVTSTYRTCVFNLPCVCFMLARVAGGPSSATTTHEASHPPQIHPDQILPDQMLRYFTCSISTQHFPEFCCQCE